MSWVVGIDLSSRAIDYARLDETGSELRLDRSELPGKDAWARTLALAAYTRAPGWYWDDVYLVAIEAPYGRGQAGTNAILNRVVGVLVATLPPQLRTPERCWIVAPHEWKKGLGLKGKPTIEETRAFFLQDITDQNARDAACIALWAREENERGVSAAA